MKPVSEQTDIELKERVIALCSIIWKGYDPSLLTMSIDLLLEKSRAEQEEFVIKTEQALGADEARDHAIQTRIDWVTKEEIHEV